MKKVGTPPAPQLPKTPIEVAKEQAAAAVRAFEQTGAHVPLEAVPKVLDGFLEMNVAQLRHLREELKASPEGQQALAQHQRDDLWSGGATAAKVVKILAGSEVPTNVKEATRLLSSEVAEQYALSHQRSTCTDPAKAAALDEKLGQLTARIATLREVHHELEGVKQLSLWERTGVMLGVDVGTGLPGVGGAWVEPGVGITTKDRQTGKREANPYVNVGGGTGVVGGGYTWSKEKGSTGASIGLSFYGGISQDNMHGKKVYFFVPNLASFMMTERGELGFSADFPVLPFVQVGFTCYVENPLIARLTAPAVEGIHRVVAPVAEKVKHTLQWVREHVLHRPATQPALVPAPA